MGYHYYISNLNSVEPVPIGARKTVQTAIGVNHKGTFSILYERDIEDGEDEDGEDEDEYNTKVYKAKFICEVKE